MTTRIARLPARICRIAGTGLAFSIFGIGAVVISLTWFPWLRLRSRDEATTRARVQGAIQSVFRLFVNVASGLGLISVEVRNAERLAAPGQLIVANHPTLIDVVLLGSLLPRVDCIVKQQLWSNPFLRWPVRWAGYIPNSETNQLLAACTASLKLGHSLLVFPTGTRTAPGMEPVFKRGAAQIALAARCPVLPIVITCDPPFLRKGESWHQVPDRSPHLIITVGEALTPDAYVRPGELPPLAARRLTRILALRLGYNSPDSSAAPIDRDDNSRSAPAELPR